MVKKLLFLLFVPLLMGTVYNGSINNAMLTDSSEGWYPWQFDWSNMDATSPANLSSILLSTPITQVTVDGVQFKRSGSRLKFFGVNICYSGNIPSNADADWWDDYLSFFGINAVRIHHADNFYTNGLLDNDGTTQNLNSTAMDKFDYLLSKLKTKGIYVNLNTNVSRPFTASEVIAESTKTNFYKGLTLFDSTLIGLEKDYISDVLNHVNAYTSIAYKNEPQIALMEMTNENSLSSCWTYRYLDPANDYANGSPFPAAYLTELDTLWNTWLQNKYTTVANVISTWGLSTLDSTQTQLFDHSTQGNLQVISPAVATDSFSSGTETITVTNPSIYWYVQYQKNFTQQVGYCYEWKMTLSASSARTIKVNIQEQTLPYDSYTSKSIDITTTPTEYTFCYSPPVDTAVSAKIFVGDIAGTVTIGNMTMKESQSFPYIVNEKNKTDFTFHRPYYNTFSCYPSQQQTDITTFYNDTVKSFYSTIHDYITTTIGSSALLTPVGGGLSYTTEANISPTADFFDSHAYYDYPIFPNTAWDSTNFTMVNSNMLLSPTLGIVGSIHGKEQATKTKPFTVTEYNDCYPNQYDYVGNLLMAIYGLQYDWDGLFIFAFSHNATFSNVSSYFDIAPNPQKMMSAGIGSYILQKATNWSFTNSDGIVKFDSDQVKGIIGDIGNRTFLLGDISVRPSRSGAVFICSSSNQNFTDSSKLVIYSFAKVRNNSSYWKDSSHFKWGTVPVELERMSVYFSMPTGTGITVNKLDTKGTVSTAVSVVNSSGTSTFNTLGLDCPWYVITK
jgi:hypothetical protein